MDSRTGAILRLLADGDAEHLATRIDRPYASVLPYVNEARELTRQFHGLCHVAARRRERWESNYNDGLLTLAHRILRELAVPPAAAVAPR